MSTHIVNIAFDFDDETIRNRVEEDAYSDVVKCLAEEARKALPQKSGYWTRERGVDWDGLVRDRLSAFFTEHADEIVKAAAGRLYESLRRTKRVREAVDGALEEAGR